MLFFGSRTPKVCTPFSSNSKIDFILGIVIIPGMRIEYCDLKNKLGEALLRLKPIAIDSSFFKLIFKV